MIKSHFSDAPECPMTTPRNLQISPQAVATNMIVWCPTVEGED